VLLFGYHYLKRCSEVLLLDALHRLHLFVIATLCCMEL